MPDGIGWEDGVCGEYEFLADEDFLLTGRGLANFALLFSAALGYRCCKMKLPTLFVYFNRKSKINIVKGSMGGCPLKILF